MIHHMLSEAEWAIARVAGEVTAPSLETEGFIHCSTDALLPGVFERHYADRTGLIILHIDEELITDSEIRWEAPAHPDGSPNTTAEEAERYPHVYGTIPVTAVVSTSAPGDPGGLI